MLAIILSILTAFIADLEAKPLSSEVTMTIVAPHSQPMTYEGYITMQGDAFKAALLGMEVAYDGKTLYLYQDDTDELTLSTPTEKELQEVNPLYLAKDLLKTCHATERQLKDSITTIVTLTPKNIAESELKSASIKLKKDKGRLLPITIELQEVGGTKTSLRFKNPQYLTSTPQFIIRKEGAFVNDLR